MIIPRKERPPPLQHKRSWFRLPATSTTSPANRTVSLPSSPDRSSSTYAASETRQTPNRSTEDSKSGVLSSVARRVSGLLWTGGSKNFHDQTKLMRDESANEIIDPPPGTTSPTYIKMIPVDDEEDVTLQFRKSIGIENS
jgi:hypothetical protein